MSLFGSLYIGDSGLRTSQNALNTVAHNLSNINTTGYVRQQVAQSDTTYTTSSQSQSGKNNQVGDGVKYSECRHVRDQFLDNAYCEETGRLGFYDISYSTILQIEDVLGEFDGASFKESVSGLWTAMQELSKDPSDVTNISLLVQKSAAFMQNASAVYNSFVQYQNNLNDQVKNAIKDINQIGSRIAELNREIAKVETGGVEHANDLRDERNFLIDNLSGYGNVTFKEGVNTMVDLQFNGKDFVMGAKAYEMSTITDKDTGFVTPYWKHYITYSKDETGVKTADYTNAYVFDTSEKISSLNDTDVGSLRAMLLARGDHIANYTDISTDMATEYKLDALNITADEYSEADGKKYYDKYISNSIMMNVEAEFDNLVHAIITGVNDVLADAAKPEHGYICNADGTPYQMFVRTRGGSAYERVILSDDEKERLEDEGVRLFNIYDEKGEIVPGSYWKYVEESADSAFSLYNCANTEINQKLLQTPSLLGFVQIDDSSDYNLGAEFVKAFENATLYLNPNATKPTSYFDCYTDLVSQVSNSGNVFKQLYEFEQLSLEQVENERQTVIGVSADEELEHMIMYQNAYNAASRYISVINSMLDSLMAIGS